MTEVSTNVPHFDLHDSLTRYLAFDGNEQANLLLTRHLVGAVNRYLWRDEFDPGHVCGSSWIVNPDISKVALIRHPILEAWMMAGGHSDGDANTLSVALRETEEEMGIKPTCLMTWNDSPIFDVDIHSIPENSKKGEPEHVHLDIRFLLMHEEVPLVSPEKIEMRWFTMDEAKSIFPKGGGRYRCIEKLTNLSFNLQMIK
jgi:8-oxo-dGTP pyrophosphatase MutT (NUDIX family)